jgi:ribosomal protein S18 acetylase RimI-like enzyme
MDIIRPTCLSQADQQHITELLLGIGWNEAQVSGQVSSILFLCQDSDSAAYYAKDGDRIAGFATCQFSRWNRMGQIHGLAVDLIYRRQGLAARLILECERFLLEKGARGVYVDTPVNNEGGRRFYEAIGYQEAYIMPQYYDAGQDGVTYQKFLSY